MDCKGERVKVVKPPESIAVIQVRVMRPSGLRQG